MEAQIATAVGVLLTAGVLWLVKTTNDTKTEFREFRVEIRAILKGPSGDNGVVGTTAALRRRTHYLAEVISWVSNRVYDLERIEGVETRPQPLEHQ